jgi:hypothetical protein
MLYLPYSSFVRDHASPVYVLERYTFLVYDLQGAFSRYELLTPLAVYHGSRFYPEEVARIVPRAGMAVLQAEFGGQPPPKLKVWLGYKNTDGELVFDSVTRLVLRGQDALNRRLQMYQEFRMLGIGPNEITIVLSMLDGRTKAILQELFIQRRRQESQQRARAQFEKWQAYNADVQAYDQKAPARAAQRAREDRQAYQRILARIERWQSGRRRKRGSFRSQPALSDHDYIESHFALAAHPSRRWMAHCPLVRPAI